MNSPILSILSIIEIIIWAVWSIFALYFVFFAFMAKKSPKANFQNSNNNQKSFLIIFPAYGEDKVIKNSVQSFLKQDYPKDKQEIIVVSDHMLPETNKFLSDLPIHLIEAHYENSTKAKALNLAIKEAIKVPDAVVILDADNVVDTNFLSKVNNYIEFIKGTVALQCHRTSKKIESPMEIYDGITEEINNAIFRNGHVRSGMPSSLIGSGMIFSYQWFKENVSKLSTSGEDKELEILLLQQNIFIDYASEINVYDEKTGSVNQYFNQRRRWIGTQISGFSSISRILKSSDKFVNISIIDKLLQWIMPPRLLLLLVPFIFIVVGIIFSSAVAYRWAIVLLIIILSWALSIPKSISFSQAIKAFSYLPVLAVLTVINIFKAHKSNKKFIHTSHG